jgi:hypothetical protein
MTRRVDKRKDMSAGKPSRCQLQPQAIKCKLGSRSGPLLYRPWAVERGFTSNVHRTGLGHSVVRGTLIAKTRPQYSVPASSSINKECSTMTYCAARSVPHNGLICVRTEIGDPANVAIILLTSHGSENAHDRYLLQSGNAFPSPLTVDVCTMPFHMPVSIGYGARHGIIQRARKRAACPIRYWGTCRRKRYGEWKLLNPRPIWQMSTRIRSSTMPELSARTWEGAGSMWQFIKYKPNMSASETLE